MTVKKLWHWPMLFEVSAATMADFVEAQGAQGGDHV